MTNLQRTLDEVSKLDREATPGKWYTPKNEWQLQVQCDQTHHIGMSVATTHTHPCCNNSHRLDALANREFISRSRTLLPRLSEALRVADNTLKSLADEDAMEVDYGIVAQEALAEINRILGET